MQWVDWPAKIGSDGVGNEDIDAKPDRDKSAVEKRDRSSTYRSWSWSSNHDKKNWNRRRIRRYYNARRSGRKRYQNVNRSCGGVIGSRGSDA